jgi:hypothetical protein
MHVPAKRLHRTRGCSRGHSAPTEELPTEEAPSVRYPTLLVTPDRFVLLGLHMRRSNNTLRRQEHHSNTASHVPQNTESQNHV